jgi:hypothetical protein
MESGGACVFVPFLVRINAGKELLDVLRESGFAIADLGKSQPKKGRYKALHQVW